MSASARAAAFAAVLAVVFTAAALGGSAVGPLDRGVAAHDDGDSEEPHAGPEPGTHAEDAPAGLAVAADGLRLVARRATFAAGEEQVFSFTVEEDGVPLAGYDVTHERRMHLIVVRRDLGAFLHLHPELRADGAWASPLRLPSAGAWRAFADFSTGGEKHTLGVDLFAYGDEPAARPAPAAERLAVVAGHRVALEPGPRRAGEETSLRFAVERDGRAVRVDEYLGARGHLVVLREGDLAYLHTHAEEDELEFETSFPSPGRYRAFLQFQVDGVVRTAEFAVEVGV